MKWKIFIGSVSLLFAVSAVVGETVTASSQPFTFPAQASIKNTLLKNSSLYFRYQFLPSTHTAVSIAWALPAAEKEVTGAIKIYSLMGKEVASFPVTAAVGTVAWKNAGKSIPTGVFLAKLAYGKYKSNLKLIICK